MAEDGTLLSEHTHTQAFEMKYHATSQHEPHIAERAKKSRTIILKQRGKHKRDLWIKD